MGLTLMVNVDITDLSVDFSWVTWYSTGVSLSRKAALSTVMLGEALLKSRCIGMFDP